ncbi:MAG: hypothetical protein P0116_02015 [Candidatus Nitrosocosmicus sp.]|nr:hypothetical protein [Candidatus Nitrosocosmicus sp.]
MSFKISFVRYPLLVAIIIMGTGIVFMFQNSNTIEAGATSFMQDDSNSTISSTPTTAVATTSALNNTFYHDSDGEINKLISAFGLPFYELTDAKDTGKEVLNIDPQQTKDSYIAQGNMKGIGNVTEYGTYISTYSSPEISSTGKGMIVQNDNVATFTAEDTGKYDNDGNLLLKGTMFFQSDDKKMESIDGKIGLYLYWKDTNGTDWTKTWLWK